MNFVENTSNFMVSKIMLKKVAINVAIMCFFTAKSILFRLLKFESNIPILKQQFTREILHERLKFRWP